MKNEFEKVIVVSGVVLKRDGKYLLVQEKWEKVRGLWNFPAGMVEKGDTIEGNAIKEAREEAGFKVELIRKIDIFQESASDSVKHAFEAKIIGGELRFPEDEIMDAKWFTFEEIVSMKDKLRSRWILDAVSILENEK
jgi:8-oxo-dGTP diphosphatase